MKLIIVYDWCVPYEASGTETLPFEYESKEQAFVDFFELVEKKKDLFEFAGKKWFTDDDFDSVKFYDLEEWFEIYKAREE
ncbi:hypothetical protein N9955_00395 [bacterium]|nr:hypothetical protein [bacterium]